MSEGGREKKLHCVTQNFRCFLHKFISHLLFLFNLIRCSDFFFWVAMDLSVCLLYWYENRHIIREKRKWSKLNTCFQSVIDTCADDGLKICDCTELTNSRVSTEGEKNHFFSSTKWLTMKTKCLAWFSWIRFDLKCVGV